MCGRLVASAACSAAPNCIDTWDRGESLLAFWVWRVSSRGERTRDDLPWAGHRVTLVYQQRRVCCQTCGARTERGAFAEPKVRITRRLRLNSIGPALDPSDHLVNSRVFCIPRRCIEICEDRKKRPGAAC